MRRSLIALASLISLAAAHAFASEAVLPGDDVTEHARAVPKFRYFSGSPARHSGRVLRWYYNPTNEPAALAGRMPSILRSATAQWSRRCSIQFEYLGVTTKAASSYDYTNVFGWGNTNGSLALTWVRSDNGTRIDDADIMFSPSLTSESAAFTAAVHEVGHALGLSHSDKESAVMSGPPYSNYTYRTEPTLDDFEGCQALYNNPYCGASKPADEFLTEAGGCPAGMEGGMRFRRSYYCADGAWVANPWERETRVCSASRATTATVATGTLKEYLRESTGQYFITASRSEQTALDSGATPGWLPTGFSWPVWETTSPELAPVCRFYGDASVDSGGKRKGPDAHFYTGDKNECAHVQVAFPVWRLETTEAFRVAMPKGGECASGTRPVTRFFRPTGDPVHRYVSDGSQAMLMLARGWLSEGVVFCLPQ